VSPIESKIFGLNSIEESRARYRETLEFFFDACRNDVVKDIELQIKPLQKPYPPLWFPSSNRDGIEFTARHGYHTAFLGKLADAKPHFDRYREMWAKHRGDAGRHNAHVAEPFLAKTQHIVIAEDDAEARRIGLAAYAAWAGHLHHLTRQRGLPDVHKNDPDAEDSAHRLITGSPAAVAEGLKEVIEKTSLNYLLCIFSFGDLAPGHAMRSLELFARDVMPKIA
jgi:alkanesulfonate monooxygenase SsuD/methylene tetrahydromethanopterin reductase-like flavin-dependent oxidoreductase (luciferase family)